MTLFYQSFRKRDVSRIALCERAETYFKILVGFSDGVVGQKFEFIKVRVRQGDFDFLRRRYVVCFFGRRIGFRGKLPDFRKRIHRNVEYAVRFVVRFFCKPQHKIGIVRHFYFLESVRVVYSEHVAARLGVEFAVETVIKSRKAAYGIVDGFTFQIKINRRAESKNGFVDAFVTGGEQK